MKRDAFYSEGLVETCIDEVAYAKQLLLEGKVVECLSILSELENTMQIMVAMDERRDHTLIN